MIEKYMMKSDEVDHVMMLLYRVFDIKITYFDLQEQELNDFHIKENSEYCETRRQNPEFMKKCEECDIANLKLAKEKGTVHIYNCHEGLMEGIVPLYDEKNNYLGAIVFGQMREKGASIPEQVPYEYQKIFKRLPEYERSKFRDIGELLKYLSEYIIRNELIKYQNEPWAKKLESYIEEHLTKKITLQDLGKVIGRSPTFVTHHFPQEFGQSPMKYIQKKKMEKARKLLEAGESVANAADSLGFYDEFHFSKSFKTYWGQPPKAYKKVP